MQNDLSRLGADASSAAGRAQEILLAYRKRTQPIRKGTVLAGAPGVSRVRCNDTEGQKLTDLKTEHAHYSAQEYVQRVISFLHEMSGWCKDRGLTVEGGAVTLREELIAPYEAASLQISRDGVSLAKVVPVGSRIIGALGRVDLIGRVARHPIIYYAESGLTLWTQSSADGKAPARKRPGVEGDGWYWIEAGIRRPKRVDESLFLDLLTDVSDYEF
jgi:hypothetical protein